MTNFDYLKTESKFNTFSDVAIAAEKILYIDPDILRHQLPQGDGVCDKMDVFS